MKIYRCGGIFILAPNAVVASRIATLSGLKGDITIYLVARRAA